jgi:hypothetical protein
LQAAAHNTPWLEAGVFVPGCDNLSEEKGYPTPFRFYARQGELVHVAIYVNMGMSQAHLA